MAALNAAGAIAIVSGSGIDLTPLLDSVRWQARFEELPGLSGATVEGHAGLFRFGACGDVPVLLQCGRRHFYEGLSYEEVVKPADLMAEWGVRRIVFTCAAGGLIPVLRRGVLMGVSSVQTWPFRRWPDRPRRVATDFMPPGVDDVGVYAWTPGPNYETPAEVRALRALGASAVGMSLAPELRHSQRLGIAAGAIAVITNACDRTEPMSHDDVVASAREQSQRLCALLRGYVAKEGGKS